MEWLELYNNLSERVCVSHTKVGSYYVTHIRLFGENISSWGMITENEEVCYEEYVGDFPNIHESLEEMKKCAEADFLKRTD